MTYKKQVLWLIFIVAIIKLIVSGLLQLSNDEVYYIVYAREFHFNYFDHPSLVGLILRFFSADLHLRHEIFLRLGFILCGAISTWLIYQTGRKLYNDFAGWMAASLFTASVYGSLISGMMVMPDAPMLLFWLWAFSKSVDVAQQTSRKKNIALLWFGVAAGLAIMSKVSAAMLWVGMGAWVLLMDRKLLKSAYLYLSVLISLTIASPLFIAMLTRHAEGAAYHAQRVAIHSLSQLRPDSFLRQVLGEFGYNNPICYALTILGIILLFRLRKSVPKTRWLSLFFSLPLILVVWFSAWFNDTLPHWTGPSFVLLLNYAAIFLAVKHSKKQTRSFPRSVKWANGLTLFALVAIILSVHFLALPFNSGEKEKLGKGDLLLDFSGWRQFHTDFDKIYQEDLSNGHMKPGAFLVCDYWFPGAHVDWYVADPGKYHLLVLGGLYDVHQYAWLNRNRPQLQPGDDAYYISVSNYYRPPDPVITGCFEKADTIQSVPQYRAGVHVRDFRILRLHHYKGGIQPDGIIK